MEESKRAKEEIEERKERNRQNRIQKKLENEKKSLIKNSKKSEKISDKKISDEKILDEKISDEKNFIKKTGLCFSCVSNITVNKLGVKCQDCSREYHVNCLKKNSLFKDFFICAVCSIKRGMKNNT